MLFIKLPLPLLILVLLANCTGSDADPDIGSHDQPVISTAKEKQADLNLLASLDAERRHNTPPIPGPISGRAYGLAELIDIAQQRNPATRQGWLQMRIAGREASIVKSALLPMIAATAVVGSQNISNSVNLPIVGPVDFDNSVSGVSGIITVNWLLFDFGENVARQKVAANLARLSTFAFNRLHQQVVFDVAFAYHTHITALEKQRYAKQAIFHAQRLVGAAMQRLDAGIGTNVEVAQARQLLAQTKLTERIATGEANSSAVSLASSLSLPPSTRVLLRSGSTKLPRIGDRKMEAVIETAFSSRPDVLASLARVRAAQNNIDAVTASYLPKVALGAHVGVGGAGFDFGGLSANGVKIPKGSGVMIGVTIPIYSGNLRSKRMGIANDQLAAARSGVGVSRMVASREIAIAYEELRTSLAVNQAARELVSAANTTADTAQKAYAGGIGTISDASLAIISLFASKEALADSRRAAYHAAATLALATGN